MEKTAYLSLYLLLTISFYPAKAQTLQVRPAGPEDGKQLSMYDAVRNPAMWPQRSKEADIRPEMAALSGEGISFARRTSLDTFIAGDGSLWCCGDGDTVLVARPEHSQMVIGQSVSRNEFGIDGGVFWSPDSTKIAFYRKDESAVTDFPLLDITTRTGTLRSIKYPMNGMASEVVSLGIFDRRSGKTVFARADDFGPDRYLTNISWGPDGRNIFIQVLDRSQKHCRLNMYRAVDGSFVRTLLEEHSDKYVEPLDPLYFIGGNYHFVYRTANRDGYRQLYLCDTLGTVRRITSCDADVAVAAVRGSSIFYTSAEVSPVENHLFRIDLTPARGRKASKVGATRIGKPLRLTSLRGWHNVAISLDGGWFLDRWSSFNDPGGVAVVSTDGKGREKFRRAFPDPLADYATGEIEFGTVPSADGSYDNYYRLFKPADFDPEKKYPVILYVYGGPHSQMVTDSWLGGVRLWEVLMAQRGYVVYVQDGRGTQNRGLAYEQAIHRRCGQAEMADQMVGIRRLMAEPWVDCDRIGVHGWSYGGFMTISLMTNYPDVFKVGVAGGPVIDWKWYEIMYGERYMETEETNPEGFAQTSLIGKAGDLKGHLLICQGAIDNTVVWQHSLSFIQACIDAGVPVDYFPYPVAEHNVFGDNRVHLMDKVTRYFEDYL